MSASNYIDPGPLLGEIRLTAMTCMILAHQVQRCMREWGVERPAGEEAISLQAPDFRRMPRPERDATLASTYLALRKHLRELRSQAADLQMKFGTVGRRVGIDPVPSHGAVFHAASAVCDAVATGLGLEPGRGPQLKHSSPFPMAGESDENWQQRMQRESKQEEVTHKPEWLAQQFRDRYQEVSQAVLPLAEIDIASLERALRADEGRAMKEFLILTACKKVLGQTEQAVG
jgi:hypothetical protein